MKTKILIVGMLLLSLLLIGCSGIPEEEMEKYCKEKGLEYGSEMKGEWECSFWISADEYKLEKFANKLKEEYDFVPKNNTVGEN